MKQLNLNSVGLGLDSVPFRFGWELLEWQPKIIESRVESGELMRKLKLRMNRLRYLGLKLN